VLSLDLALTLRAAGLAWSPAPGDAFVIPGRDLDDQVFVVSDMVVQTMDVPHGPAILAFNGTTEWALDSLEAQEAVWLPREDQLRGSLGDAFASLERLTGDPSGYAVTVAGADGPVRHVDVTVEAAYARAVLATLSGLH
jgi:hypothetical protein